MVSGRPKYVYPDPNRHGKLRYYMCRGKGQPKYQVRGEIGTPDFWEAYARFVRGEHPYEGAPATSTTAARAALKADPSIIAAKRQSGVIKPNTLAWLIEQYTNSNEWKGLAKATRRPRELQFEKILKLPHPRKPGMTWGECPLVHIEPKHIKEIRDSNLIWIKPVDPETGEEVDDEIATNKEGSNGWLKALRAAFAWGFNDTTINLPMNPCLGIKLYPGSKEGFHTWTLQEIEHYRSSYEIKSKERLGFELLLQTGQRRGDVVRLGENLLTKDSKGRPMFSFRQEKNSGNERGTNAYIPYWQELCEIVEATPCAGKEFFLCQANGDPYTKESFGNMFREWCDNIGLHDCSAHGLRKAFVVDSIRKKRHPREIMAVTGHTTQKEFDRYAREYMRQHAVEQWLDDYEAEFFEAA